ncbi:MAG: riboflavin synthase, partial [Myxococcota bacterium]
MFTGITRGLFAVTQVERAPDLLRFVVDLAAYGEGLELGASVSIDGVCQTVVAVDESRITFEAIRETLAKTTLGSLEVGTKVSVERSARVGDEVGGHDVSGHVTGTGTLGHRETKGHDVSLRIDVPKAWMKYILHKGFVALDGSSLTVGERDDGG